MHVAELPDAALGDLIETTLFPPDWELTVPV